MKEASKKLLGVKAGTEGVAAHTMSMKEAGVYGWFLEAAVAVISRRPATLLKPPQGSLTAWLERRRADA
jgi:hypothetical protein